jgi:hypothetical protein
MITSPFVLAVTRRFKVSGWMRWSEWGLWAPDDAEEFAALMVT